MSCIGVRKKLSAWLDNELPDPEAQRVANHLAGCPVCRLEAEGIGQVAAMLDALPAISAPASLSGNTLAVFRARLEPPAMGEWWRSLSLAMRGAVCGAALAGLLCGAVLGTSLPFSGSDGQANPYQALYASKGILP